MGIFNFFKKKTNENTLHKSALFLEMTQWIDSVL